MKKIVMLIVLCLSSFSLFAQWSDSPSKNNQLLDRPYLTLEVASLPDGSFYVFYDTPDPSYDTIVPFLAYFDNYGKPMWNEPIAITRQPTLTWVKTMTHMVVDHEGNVVVAVQNRKRQLPLDLDTYTVFKISKDGEYLWGEDGVDLHGGFEPTTDLVAALKLIEIEDGSFIFAWMADEIMMQRVSADGKVLWGEGKRLGYGAYPYLVDAGMNEYIMLYQTEEGLMARKFDFDGNDVWAQPTVVFNGELNGSIPLWTYLEVIPVNGGFLAGWYAFENEFHYPGCSYVKSDGSHGFSEAEAGLRLSYNEAYAGYAPKLAYDDKNQVIYAVWNEAISGRSFGQHVSAQKVSLEGELLWDANAVELCDVPENDGAAAYCDVELGPDGTVLFAYLTSGGLAENSPETVWASLLNSEGNFVWKDSVKKISDVVSVKYNMKIIPYVNNQWVLLWRDCRLQGPTSVSQGTLFGQNIGFDGTMGDIKPSQMENLVNVAAIIAPNPVVENATIQLTNMGNTSWTKVSLLNMQGQVCDIVFEGYLSSGNSSIEWMRPRDLSSGFYIMRVDTERGSFCKKMVVR